MENMLKNIKSKEGFIIDMDGVIYHGNRLLPGVIDFLAWRSFREKIPVPDQLERKDSERTPGKAEKTWN